ncbi:4,5-dihydroxyphthalate decarboxylase [Rhodococcus wratislaviensis]|uniref:ABC-type taurine transport system, periplasmic component n=1 Tax=Rhodococcus wratislaviensis TaxID=44752 RepID=A0AB38FCY7_RHOWR|nr:ABC transporter substrate-binding protein [Rhodococcus wratislaviensis]REE75471.1 4,5-dihydroxyphthalate decarboxylase [Rhodococcus wratislaviensis]SPZ39495.1 ABC-type taurine transport system, periplasmic component [Rhodococcus wratislaviensis]
MPKERVLRTVFESRGYTSTVADGTLAIPGVSIDFVDAVPISSAMNAVADGLQFDVGEITLIDYMIARELGRPLVALPIFPNRNFPHDRILYRADSGIEVPKDLEGKRIGVKSYPQTAPVWGRGILHDQYGVDLNRVTWVALEGAHLDDFRNPSNVEMAPAGSSLAELLASGDIDAADDPGRPWRDRGERWDYDSTEIKPLVPNPAQDAADWYRKTGVYPILHVIVIKQEVLTARPDIARTLFDAFTTAKQAYLDVLDDPTELKARGRSIVGPDFLPYGISPNRAAIDTLCEFAHHQKITTTRYQVEDLFGPHALFDE